jgi:hypothetical protein
MKRIEDHVAAANCAQVLKASLLLWGSIFEAPLVQPSTISINPKQIITAAPAPHVGSIDARDRAKVSVGDVVATMSISVNVPSPKPFSLLVNATSVRYSGTMLANTRFDVGSLADIASTNDLSASSLASIPFVAGYSFFDRRQFTRAGQLFELAQLAADRSVRPRSTGASASGAGNTFSEHAVVMRAAALIWGQSPKAGVALLTEALKVPRAQALSWQAHVLRAFGYGLMGEHSKALLDLKQATLLAADGEQLAQQQGTAELWWAIALATTGQPGEALRQLAVSAAKRSARCRASEDDPRATLFCELNETQDRVVRAIAWQWLGKPAEARVCLDQSVAKVESVMAQVEKSPELMTALPLDSPNGGAGCEGVHLAATGFALFPDAARDAATSKDLSAGRGTLGHLLHDAALSPLLRLALTCGIVNSGLVQGDPAPLFDEQAEQVKREASPLLHAELELIRARWLAENNQPKDAATLIARQLPIVRQAFGANSPVTEEWNNYLLALRTGQRPESRWRKRVIVPEKATCQP